MEGDFFIRAAEGDSLIATSVGFGRYAIKWDKSQKEPVFSLDQTAIALEEIVVKDKKSETIEREIKAFLDNPTNAKTMRRDILGNMVSAGTSNPSGGGMSISIDALYDLWSKEGKSKRKAAELEYQDVKKFYVELRYNKRKVSSITGFKDQELDDFMNFCKLSDDFVLNANDYDLTYEIFRCRREFAHSAIPGVRRGYN